MVLAGDNHTDYFSTPFASHLPENSMRSQNVSNRKGKRRLRTGAFLRMESQETITSRRARHRETQLSRANDSPPLPPLPLVRKIFTIRDNI